MHCFNTRIYYEDTDAGGIVYHANYLKFAERARTEMIRDWGYTNSGIRQDLGIIFVVRHMDIDFKAPLKLDDYIAVETTVHEIGNTSFTLQQKIIKNSHLHATMMVKLVCIEHDSGKPVRIPTLLKDKLNEQ